MIVFRNSIAVFLNNAGNSDLKFEKFLKFMVFKEPPFLISRSKFLFFFTEYGRWSSLPISPLSFMILFLNSIAHFLNNAVSPDSSKLQNQMNSNPLLCFVVKPGVKLLLSNFIQIRT